MALTPRLDLRQSQTLVMTPQLQQAIKLLQMSNLELSDFVETELERNPLLERDEGQGEPGEGDGAAEPERTERTADQRDSMDLTSSETLPSSGDAPLDADYENLWASADAPAPGPAEPAIGEGSDLYWSGAGSGGSRNFDDDEGGFEERLTRKPDLHEHLTEQLLVEIDDPADRIIGTHLVDLVDANGYIPADLDSVAEILACPVEQVEATLRRLQRFDPPGVFARSLSECLALQLADRNRLDPAMQALLDNLDVLARHDVARLIRLCGVDAEDVTDMIAEIRALDPKPGSRFDLTVAEPITPDIVMRQGPEGEWIVELNSDNLPRVLVNTRYSAQVNGRARSKEDKEYIQDQLQSANWLVKSLHQRATTILKVATEIVRQQELFFIYGVQHLRPLVLRDIAEAIDMHESTVSRVTTNKYMATPRGLYELKYFFTASIPSAGGGDAHSAEAVRHRIKRLIDAETASTVLSDDQLVTLLEKDGIDIARRTVAKYREAMKIPSSVQRRRQLKLRG